MVTDQGEVACEIVVNAAGLWARHVGEMAGIELPVTVVEHQYLVTEKSPLIPDELPTLRDPDLNFYLKSEPGALAIGGWERGTIAVEWARQAAARLRPGAVRAKSRPARR